MRLVIRLVIHLIRTRPPAEILVVSVLLILVLAVAAPAILQMREQARLHQTKDQLRQIGMSMQNYHDTYLSFPSSPQSPREEQTPSNAESRADQESNDLISPLTILGPAFR